jgi:hypothetical protein
MRWRDWNLLTRHAYTLIFLLSCFYLEIAFPHPPQNFAPGLINRPQPEHVGITWDAGVLDIAAPQRPQNFAPGRVIVPHWEHFG